MNYHNPKGKQRDWQEERRHERSLNCQPFNHRQLMVYAKQKVSSARSKFESMALYGDNFERSTKTLAIKNTLKSIDGTGKHGGNCLESMENASVRSPVFCGPCFRPWSRGKKETRKYITRGHYNQPEANVQWFYLKHQRSRSDCFNLTKVLSEVHEISRFNENHVKNELVPTTTSFEILMPALVNRGDPSSSYM